MKVLKRILIKSFILLFVIALSAGGAAGLRGYRESTAQYAIDTYVRLLIENSGEKAFKQLDQSEGKVLTQDEYLSVLETEQYSLFSSFTVKESETRLDNNGNEYTDFNVEFLDASGAVQKKEAFTAKKQAAVVFGIFDRWLIMSSHCMIENFGLTVPAGSEVYLNNEAADAAWIVREGMQASYDHYQIPTLLPGKYSLVVRHPALESVNATLDPSDGNADYTDMALKESSKNECTEMGVKALKALYKAAASEKTEEFGELFADCLDTAEKYAEDQVKEFHKEDAVFRQAAISGFAPQFGDPVFTESENGAITAEMEFSWHYVVREDVTAETGEYNEDGSSVTDTEEKEYPGDATGKFQMSWHDGAWHIASFELPVIPEQ